MSIRSLASLILPQASRGLKFVVPPQALERWSGRKAERLPTVREIEAVLCAGGMTRRQARDTIHDIRSGSREASGAVAEPGLREAAGGNDEGDKREAVARQKLIQTLFEKESKHE